jgi:nucleoside-diphosphate-sugar epimerase
MVNDLLNRRVGLIGADGFIGSAILHALVHSGVTPRVVCGPGARPRPASDGIDSLICDLTDAEGLRSWISGLDLIIHAAGPPSVQRSFEIPQEYARVHVEGTATVLRACHEAKVDRLIYVSSAEVYGRPEMNPVSENHRLQARSPYAAAKIGAEKMIEAYVESFGLKAVILRPFSIYGPNPPPESLLGTIIIMTRGGSVRLRDLRPIRDYCYVGDLAKAALQASCLIAEKLEIFNIGTGEGTNVADFAALALRSMGRDLPVVEDRTCARPGQSEIFELVADVSKARRALGWLPKTDLEKGLRLALAIRPSKA